MKDGFIVGKTDGFPVGTPDGKVEGTLVGMKLGTIDGVEEGKRVGESVRMSFMKKVAAMKNANVKTKPVTDATNTP